MKDGVCLMVRGSANWGLRSRRRGRDGALYAMCEDRCLVENIDLALRSRRYEGTELSLPSNPFSSAGGGRTAENPRSLTVNILSALMDGSGVDEGGRWGFHRSSHLYIECSISGAVLEWRLGQARQLGYKYISIHLMIDGNVDDLSA